MTRAHKNSGFTLMEIVVAISLMAVLMAILFMGLRLSANAWRRGEQKMNDHERIMAGNDVLARQIAAAVAWSTFVTRDDKPVQVVGFTGSGAEARFITTDSWRGDRFRPQYLADYRIVGTAQRQQQLVISETGLTDGASILAALRAPLDPQTPVQPIDDPADAVEFSYYRPATVQQPAAWVGTWEPQAGAELPRAIQVRWRRGNAVQTATFPITSNNEPQVRF